MVASTNVHHRVCENRECRKEFTTTDSRKKTCDRKCTDREKYLRRLDKKSRGKVVEIKSSGSPIEKVSHELPRDENEPKNSQADDLGDYQRIMIDLQKEQIEETRLLRKAINAFLAASVLEPAQERTDLPKVPFSKPIELDTDELPVVEVKKSKASSNSSSNFLNSIMALNG